VIIDWSKSKDASQYYIEHITNDLAYNSDRDGFYKLTDYAFYSEKGSWIKGKDHVFNNLGVLYNIYSKPKETKPLDYHTRMCPYSNIETKKDNLVSMGMRTEKLELTPLARFLEVHLSGDIYEIDKRYVEKGFYFKLDGEVFEYSAVDLRNIFRKHEENK